MRDRSHYCDHGLVFAKEWVRERDRSITWTDPLQMKNIDQREFKKIIEAAKVPTIKFHGLRHT